MARTLEESRQRASVITQFLEQYFDEVKPMDFYRAIFPEGSFERRGEYIDGKYNGIVCEIDKSANRKVRRYTVTDDLEALRTVIERNEDEFCITHPIGYAGKSARNDLARELYALAIDLDGIQVKECGDSQNGIYNFYATVESGGVFPTPTYVVMSGTGLHLYYVFDEPIKMYRQVVSELQKLKDALTALMWYGSITYLDYEVQYEPINQPFRVVGTSTKIGTKTRAFVWSGERVTVDYLNQFVPEEKRAALDKEKQSTAKYTLEEAAELFPQWHEDYVINHQKKKIWKFKRDVYDSWKRRILTDPKIHFGNRYWSLFILASAGACCKGVTYEEVEQDVYSLVPFLNSKKADSPFTDDDAASALAAYGTAYTLTVDFINWKCDGILPKNKRNGRKQEQHLAIARGIRKLRGSVGECVSGGGRPSKQQQVAEWRKSHPDGRKIDCERDTGLSRPTVLKWWGD